MLCSFVMGVRYGFQPGPETVLYARDLLPNHSELTAIGIGKAAFTSVAQSYLAGPVASVAGLEDTVYLLRGAGSRPPTRKWSPRHGASSRTSAERRPRRSRKLATSPDCRQGAVDARGVGESTWT